MIEAIGLGWLFGVIFFFGFFFGLAKGLGFLIIFLAIFALLNYFIRLNIKEFLKSYFLTFFIIFLITIIIGFYVTYGVDNVDRFVLMDPPEVKKLLPDEYYIYIYLKALFQVFMFSTFFAPFIVLCLLQAYLFKCYSTGVKRKKISWFIGFVCSSPFILMFFNYINDGNIYL
ncbi:hypothetical protein [Campylobacter taeniopygiae]|uniref:Uncharacterized protein n=1 Tax=Campylobacter taeniopygiae TaxID=2510188 RepID=A0ABY2TGY1_9BACT|nr:hypothetical protein [Campylobacter taeniopygiae]TKX33246.1 hypothetical protein CQA75_08540 [Campylobacter taeniopygiae]